jgi:hypothetical protein
LRFNDYSKGYWSAFAASFALLVVRGWDRLTHPELFAEGGRQFVADALNHGWTSLFTLYDYYFHTAPRLIAILAVKLAPVAAIPAATMTACFTVTAAAAAMITRPAYRWLIPSDTARFALALLVCLTPGLPEILGNLPNLHWVLLFALAVLMLKDPMRPYRIWELLLVGLVVLSDGAAVIFLPLAAIRTLLIHSRQAPLPGARSTANHRRLGEWIVCGILSLTAVYLTANFMLHHGGAVNLDAKPHSLDSLLYRLEAIFVAFYWLHPFLGTDHLTDLMYAVPFNLLLVAGALLMAALLWALWRRSDRRFYIIPVWLACLFLIPLMLSLVREWAFYGLDFRPPYRSWWFRYHFVFAATGLVFVSALLRPTDVFRIGRLRNLAAAVLIAAYAVQAHSIFRIERYGEERVWARYAPLLEQSMATGCPARVTVTTYPTPKWRFVYENPRARPDCPTK